MPCRKRQRITVEVKFISCKSVEGGYDHIVLQSDSGWYSWHTRSIAGDWGFINSGEIITVSGDVVGYDDQGRTHLSNLRRIKTKK